MSVDLLVPIRDVLIASSQVTSRVAAYLDSYAIFTRTPVPQTPPPTYPMIVINPAPLSTVDEDGVNDFRTIVTHELNIYGLNDQPGHQALVNQLSWIIRALFHRQPVLSVIGWGVIDIQVTGPSEAPIDDQASGQALQLRVRLAQLR